VLVVTATRAEAQQIARGLADELPVNPGSVTLHDFVRQQLGDDHPLVHVVRHGVGFHHAGLPTEVLEALEDAVRADTLPYLACTSTLTEGVNLPVRTVVIYDSPRPDLHDDARLRGPRLVNAIGRAGRAGKETEGWIVLVRAAEPTDASASGRPLTRQRQRTTGRQWTRCFWSGRCGGCRGYMRRRTARSGEEHYATVSIQL
jgi:replicative superfamily II helicase